MSIATDKDISRYYDANTGKFLNLGGSGELAAIHRAIWAPGVTHRRQAFSFLNELVGASVQPLAQRFPETLRLLDLGCGVGGTATWLHHALGVDVVGVNISAHQVQQARMRAQQLGCADHVTFVHCSFEEIAARGGYHAACAIESFVHCQHPDRFLATARECLLPGGRLVVCDDFASPAPPPQAAAWIARFRRGWKVNHFMTRDDFLQLANAHGFSLVTATDLSSCVRSFSWPVLLVLRGLTRIPLPWAYWDNLAGGTALQVCLQRSFTQYHAIVLERI